MSIHPSLADRRGAAADVRHLDQHALAVRWGVSVRTLERWRFLNQGPAFLKLIGRVVYRLEDVEAFETTQMRHGTKDSAPARSPAA
jgi:hypothetical protein